MRFLAPYQGIILSFVRIVVAYMFMLHGLAKAFGFPMAMGEGPLDWASMEGVAAILELVGGGLLVLGLFTRPAAFILSGQMAVAYFMVHAKSALFFPLVNHGESAAMFSLIFLYFAAAGGGSLSLDRAISRYDD